MIALLMAIWRHSEMKALVDTRVIVRDLALKEMPTAFISIAGNILLEITKAEYDRIVAIRLPHHW